MQDYQRNFFEFVIRTGALKFGKFTLKSGRVSPYFFNSGLFNSGASLDSLGKLYAAAINEDALEFDVLFGPAYKGIPLACTTAIALSSEFGKDVAYAFNRKETKDHGEGGNIVGEQLHGNVLVIDDVISAGTSIRESVDIIKQSNAKISGVVIALDRQERGKETNSAIAEIESNYDIKVKSIAKLSTLIEYLSEDPKQKEIVENIIAYRDVYGI